jgi:hypothetical protein
VSEEFVTIAEAAERWSVPARRVRHVLERCAKRGGNVPQTLQKTFRTKTGERSAVAYPVAWLGALLEAEPTQEETLQRSASERSANEAKRGAEPFQHSAPERSEGDAELPSSDWKARALVAEARAELLATSLADTQSERDRWASQAESLAEALQRAQDEARAARLIGGRPMQQIEAHAAPAGDSDASEALGGALYTPRQKTGFWSFLRRWW